MSTFTVGQRLGPYEVAASIGAGGMGEVYQALDTRLNRIVAIKVSREQFSERFEREAHAIAALNHANICTLHDIGPNYLVMELVEGPTLADRIASGPIPLEESLHIARQIGDALESAHDLGIVHRDLKPANIKIKPDGLVKVLDFGLAKVGGTPAARLSDNSPTIGMSATQAGVILGTAAYMAPEQARGKPVDKRADIWAFGVVLYEMITGRRLFEGEDTAETLALVIKGEPKWDGIPANVQRLLKSCLEKDPRRRLRDIGDVWRLLEHAPEPAPSKVPLLGRLGVVASIIAALAVAGVLALSFVHFREKPPTRELVRFQVFPPAQSNFAGNDAASISPDGRQVAFQLQGPDGRTQLWVRSLDSLESRPLAGTDGVFNASFWSPDSRFIGFSVQGKLKKVEPSGGPAQTVCDIPGASAGSGPAGQLRAGTWSSDGVILFGTADTGLWRVPEAGGAPVQVTSLDPSRKEAFHGGPYFLPDGRHFIYNRIAPGDHNGVYLGSLDAKPEQQSARRLLAGEANAAYAPASNPGSNSGYVLFTREDSLMAQPFDLRRLELTGEAVPIAEGMGRGAPRPFSASMTGVLAYRAGFGGRLGGRTTQLAWVDREGKSLGTAGEPGRYNTVALSHDGTRVAVSRTDQVGRLPSGRPPSQIWVYEFARGISTRLTTDPAAAWLATWSPDGSSLIFSSKRDGGVYNLYRKVSSGAGYEELLFRSNEDKSAQDWSRDGRFLLYSIVVNRRGDTFSTSHDLWVLPLAPGNPDDRKPKLYLKTEFDENQGQFSPDGRFVAYTSNASGSDEIYVQPFPTASDGKWTVSKGGGVAPRWRGDGKELFYVSADSKMMAVDVSTNPAFKPGIPKALFRTSIAGGVSARHVIRYDVTADGKKFLINSLPVEPGAPGEPPITMVMNWTALLKK